MTGPHRPSADPAAAAEAITEQFAAVPREPAATPPDRGAMPTEQFAALPREPDEVPSTRFAAVPVELDGEPPRQDREPPQRAEPEDPGVAPYREPPRRILMLAGVALLGWVADLVTKVIAVEELEGRPPVTVIENVLYVQLVRNGGAAFALATGMTWLLTLIAVGVVVAIFRVAGRLRSAGWAVALGLVLGGALGNLTDRLFRSPGPLVGRVVDFVSVLEPDGLAWPVFNVADSAICTGGALLVLLALMGRELDGTRSRDHREALDG